MSSPMKWQRTVLQGQWEERDETELGEREEIWTERKKYFYNMSTLEFYTKKRGGGE